MSIVKLENIDFVRDGNKILDNVNFEISAGENWIILGSNGVGKTTLVQMIAGRLFPTSGKVTVLDQQLGTFPTEYLHQSVGFASSALLDKLEPTTTVSQVILTAAYGMTVSWRETYEELDYERANALMKIFGIDHLAERYICHLSHGELQKTLLARALMSDPEILVLDEPANGLDIGAREDLMLALKEIATAKKAPAIVMVTHHVEQIPEGFTHIMLMKNSTVAYKGLLDDVLTDDNLSDTFSYPLTVSKIDGRYFAKAK